MKTLSISQPTTDSFGLHWFRRDLRVAGNPALQWSWKEHSGRVVGIFAFDPKFLARPDFSVNRFAFFLETLRELQNELRSIGSDLLVLDQGPDEAFAFIFESLARSGVSLPATISFNRDYEPFARERDERLTKTFTDNFAVKVHTERDHILIEPTEILKDERVGSTYQIYSPFAKRWFAKLSTPQVLARIEAQTKGLDYLKQRREGKIPHSLFNLSWEKLLTKETLPQDQLENYERENLKLTTIAIPQAGSIAALDRLDSFQHDALRSYAEMRDRPDIDGTSKLSMFLKNGSITGAQILAALNLQNKDFASQDGPGKFVKEIAWREFYYYILFHHPRVEYEAFLSKFKGLEWENREDYFEAWKTGMTGFPIIDAGMRQLNQTGWMHNRVRMIVASFLTKDLLINWQWGERYFMEKLLDGDLAPNNGGWQWAASTGCDPQPYFRIFNPLLQSHKFDPEGNYIRKYIPELAGLTAKEIHEPMESAKSLNYPPPIVNHQEQKEKALELYDVSPQTADTSVKFD